MRGLTLLVVARLLDTTATGSRSYRRPDGISRKSWTVIDFGEKMLN